MKASFEQTPGAGRMVGRVRGLAYNPDKEAFQGLLKSVSTAGLGVTTPVTLPLEVRSVQALAAGIKGWLSGAEMCALFEMAQAVPLGYSIVEIGSYQGRSTVCLGWGARLGNRSTVYAVDTHEGSPEHAHSRGDTAGGTLPFFRANVERAGLQDIVVPVVASSERAVELVQGPVGFLFIDGDHNDAGFDFSLWSSKLADDALVAFHDFTDWEPVRQSVEFLLSLGMVEIHDRVDSMLICKKCTPGVQE